MSHDKQDKTYSESRSKIGTMDFMALRKFIGVDANPDGLEEESGTAQNPEGGVRNSQKSNRAY